jgi:SAM-dependent methyltransferase
MTMGRLTGRCHRFRYSGRVNQGYLLGNDQPGAAQRFEALAELFDASTFRHIEALGLREGWRCWEVGAGGPTVPGCLADRVGRAGHVLATDIDTSLLTGHAFDVRRHDIGVDPSPGTFDLVHARLVLVHVEDRERALETMARSVRPGGWLLVEEADPGLQPKVCPDEHGPEERLANNLKDGFRALMAARGVDLSFGRTLPRLLRAAGLTEVGADGYFPVTGPACDRLETATVHQIRDRLVAGGLATDAEIERHLDNVRAGRLDLTVSPMVSAWGRR